MNKNALAALVALVFVVNVFTVLPVRATTYFTEGFESGFGAWEDYGGGGPTGITTSTTWKQAGTYSLTDTAAGEFEIVHVFSPAYPSHIITYDFYVNFDSNGADYMPTYYIEAGDMDLGKDGYLAQVAGAYDDTLAFTWLVDGSTYDEDTAYTPVAYHDAATLHIQIYVKVATTTNSADGEARLTVDGSEYISRTGLNNYWDFNGGDHTPSLIGIDYYADYVAYTDSILVYDTAPGAPDKSLTVSTATWRLTMPQGTGTTNVTGTASYPHGANITVSATPGSNSHFRNWILTGATPGNYTANPISISLTVDSTLTAVFDWGTDPGAPDGFDDPDWADRYTLSSPAQVWRNDDWGYISAPWALWNSGNDPENTAYFFKTLNSTWYGDYHVGFWTNNPTNPMVTFFDQDWLIQAQLSYHTSHVHSVTWSNVTASPFFADGSPYYYIDGWGLPHYGVRATPSYSATTAAWGHTFQQWVKVDIFYWNSTDTMELFIDYVSAANFTVNNPAVDPKYVVFGNPYNYYNGYNEFSDGFIIDDLSFGEEAGATAPPTVTVAGDGIFNGDGDGTWVFVGPKNYVFYIDYTGTPTGYELGFTTSDARVYSWAYNETSGLVTNTAPNDGVSGAYVSNNGTRALFNLKFNLPVADSLNITLYSRVWDNVTDTGPTAGSEFNIYNLGGYAVIDADGWAGRIRDVETGQVTGDVFEIYAADSRTALMVDAVNFGSMGTFPWFEWRADPRKALPLWDFDLFNATAGFIELKLDDMAPGVRPFPFYAGKVDGSPSSMHIYSAGVDDYTPRASIEFRRPVDDETVNATYWVLFHGDTTYAKIRLAQNNLYTVSGFEASTVEIKNTTICYRLHDTTLDRLYNATADTWYRVSQVVDLVDQTQIITICSTDLTQLATTGEIGVYQNVTYLDHFNVIAQDSGDPSATCDLLFDELTINSDFDQPYGGVVKASMIYHRLQQWRQDFDFSIEEGTKYTDAEYADYGFIELGLDYMVNGEWVNSGLWCRVNVTDSNIQNQNNWVKYTVSWYRGATLLRNDTLYGLFYGYSGADIGDARKDATGLHFATWFNRANASTVVAGRVNMEYYGMSDKAPWWSLFSSDWKPMLSDVDESTCYMRILDADGNPCTVKDVSLVRAWERVYRTNSSTFHYSIQNIREQNFQTAGATMEGIDTPPVTKTQTPTMPGGFLGSALAAIFASVIRRLGDGLLWGGLMVWTSFVGFIDVIASYFGAQGWFSYVMAQVGLGMQAVTVASGYLFTINLWIWGGIMWIFGWFGSFASFLLLWFDMLGQAWGMVTGTYVGTVDLISTFQLGTFALILVICLPLIIVDRMATRGFFETWDEIGRFWGAAQWIFDYLSGLIDAFVTLVFRLIEAIPIAE